MSCKQVAENHGPCKCKLNHLVQILSDQTSFRPQNFTVVCIINAEKNCCPKWLTPYHNDCFWPWEIKCSGMAWCQHQTREEMEQWANIDQFISILTLCGSRNYPYYPHGRSLEIPRGRGDLKAKLLEGQYEAKLEISLGVWGCKTKNLPWGEYGYFLEQHIENPPLKKFC